MRAAIYTRISRDDTGEGLGVRRQEEACRELAARLGWQVVDVYSDNDVSAYSGKPRRQYRRLLADIEAGKVTGVLAWHADRLHRQTRELEEYIEIARDIPTQTVSAGQIDLSTSSGRAVAKTIGTWAQHQSEQAAERIRAKHAELRREGKMVGARTFGWKYEQTGTRLDPRTGEEKPVHRTLPEVDPKEAALIREAATRILAGGSVARIAREWNAAGYLTTRGKPWCHGNLRTLLKNPKMAGLRAHQKMIVRDESGNPVRGQWEPILDVPTWERLCSVFNARRHFRAGAARHLLGGIIRCECGAVMFGCERTDYRSKRRIAIYDCSGCSVAVVKSKVEPKVFDAIVSSVLFDSDESLGTTTTSHTALAERLSALRTAESRLLDLVEANVFSVAEIAAKRSAVRAGIEVVARELDGLIAQDAVGLAIRDARRALWSGGKVSIAETVKVRRQIRARLGSLDFDTQRALIRGSLQVTVRRVGKGSKEDRVLIKHLVATSLNDDAQFEEVA